MEPMILDTEDTGYEFTNEDVHAMTVLIQEGFHTGGTTDPKSELHRLASEEIADEIAQ